MQMMKKVFTSLLVAVLILLAFGRMPAYAQEADGFTESFDDPTLPGWEHAREAIITGGVLHMDPGSFALHIGDWSEINLSVRCKFSGEGEVVLNYYFREGNRYSLHISTGNLTLEKEQDRVISSLGQATSETIQPDTWLTIGIIVKGGDQQISINNENLLTASDTNPLETGAFLMEAMGGVTIEFDDLAVQGKAGTGGPAPVGEPGLAEEPAVPPVELNPVATQVTPVTTQAQSSQFFQEFFASQASQVELTTFLINLLLAAVCASILSLVYIHWGTSLSNRRKFSSNFMLMTITTTFIILVVRSSVALSLGLVGALSIVRFRTAVKEPEELAYLFFAIGIGIGLGDNQRMITLLALVVGIALLGFVRLFRRTDTDINLHLTITERKPGKVDLDGITNALKPYVSKLKLLRFDENPDMLETGFLIEIRKSSDLSQVRNALRALSETVEITFMDNKGIW